MQARGFGSLYVCSQAPEMQSRDTWLLIWFKMKQSERETGRERGRESHTRLVRKTGAPDVL